MKKLVLIMFAFLFCITLPFAVVGCDKTSEKQEDGFVYEDEVKYNYVGYTCQKKGDNQYLYVFELRVENNTEQDVDIVKSEYGMSAQWYQYLYQSMYYWKDTTFHIYIGEINQNEILISSTLKSRSSATLIITTDILPGTRLDSYDNTETLKKVSLTRGTEVIAQIQHTNS